MYCQPESKITYRAADWVADSLNFDASVTVPASSSVSKAIGGLLSAQDFSNGHDTIFLEKAAQLMLKLLQAFNKGGQSSPSICNPTCLSGNDVRESP